MSFSVHTDNKKKDILILVKGPTEGLEDILTAEKMYSINFAVQTMKIVSAKKKVVARLTEECTETVEEVKLARITLAEK